MQFRLFLIGRIEAAGLHAHLLHGAGKGNTIYMHVEHVHEDGNFLYAFAQKAGVFNFLHHNNLAVGWRDNSARFCGQHPYRVAEEIEHKACQGQKEQGRIDKAQKGENKGAQGAENEKGRAFLCHGNLNMLHAINQLKKENRKITFLPPASWQSCRCGQFP